MKIAKCFRAVSCAVCVLVFVPVYQAFAGVNQVLGVVDDVKVTNAREVVLADGFHVETGLLESQSAMHYYNFNAVRGQKVLLAYPEGYDQSAGWVVEYLEGEDWKVLTQKLKVFSGVEPGSDVKARVLRKRENSSEPYSYQLAFGSAPVLQQYELKDQYRMKRIPSGHTQPSFIPVQGAVEAYLEAYFTDSTGAPLKGAIGRFQLDLSESMMRPVIEQVVSDDLGKVSKTISFARCYGGRESKDINYFYGEGTWKSYYYVGSYNLDNVYSDRSTQVVEDRVFGHVCGHRRINR